MQILKYFHVLMRGRRRRLFIHRICTDDDNWIQGDANIAATACNHFQKIFTRHEDKIDEGLLQCIPRLVDEEYNQILQALPTMEELKHVIFAINPNSALS